MLLRRRDYRAPRLGSFPSGYRRQLTMISVRVISGGCISSTRERRSFLRRGVLG